MVTSGGEGKVCDPKGTHRGLLGVYYIKLIYLFDLFYVV